MSIDDIIIKREEYENMVKQALIQMGYLKECPSCGYYYISNTLDSTIYGRVTNYFKEQEMDNKYDYTIIHSIIKKLFDESGFETIEEHINANH